MKIKQEWGFGKKYNNKTYKLGPKLPKANWKMET